MTLVASTRNVDLDIFAQVFVNFRDELQSGGVRGATGEKVSRGGAAV